MDEIEQFFATEERNRLEADSKVQETQILHPGDYGFMSRYGIRIYFEILDEAETILRGRTVEELEEEELEELRCSVYQEPHMKFYRLTRSFSKVCPRGELGDIHLSMVTGKLTKDEFEAARKTGWL